MTEAADPPEPLRSVHTTSLPELLRRAGVTLLVSTYQADKLLLGPRYPDLLTGDDPIVAGSFVLPDEALADVPAK